MTRIRSLLLTVSLAASMTPDFAVAQEVSEQRIISGLGKLVGAAPLIDIATLRQEAIDGGGVAMAWLPNWGKIAKLPQMLVEIDFENDSVMIKPESYRSFGQIADALHHLNLWAYKFLIVGHSSSTGSDKHNLELSEKRAAAIGEILSTTFAVDPKRLYAVGVGEYFPIDGSKGDAAKTDASSLSIWVSSRRRNATSGRETTNARRLAVGDGWPSARVTNDLPAPSPTEAQALLTARQTPLDVRRVAMFNLCSNYRTNSSSSCLDPG